MLVINLVFGGIYTVSMFRDMTWRTALNPYATPLLGQVRAAEPALSSVPALDHYCHCTVPVGSGSGGHLAPRGFMMIVPDVGSCSALSDIACTSVCLCHCAPACLCVSHSPPWLDDDDYDDDRLRVDSGSPVLLRQL